MIKHSQVTFIIVSFKSEKILDKTLKNLPQRSKKILIDNSGNKKLLILEKKYKNLKCFIMQNNLGYGVANNFGIKKAKTKYVFILNPDVIFKNKDFDNICKIIGSLKFSLLGFMSKSERIQFAPKKSYKKVKEVKGFAIFAVRQDLKKCLFDENIFLYLEEIDLCRRIILHGGDIYLLNYTLNHVGGNSHSYDFFEMEKSRNWHWMWSQFYFKKKYNGYILSLLIFTPTLLITTIKFIFCFNNKKKLIYKSRLSGLFNSMLGNKSFYRPYL